jgi:ribosome maturation protein SDO1
VDKAVVSRLSIGNQKFEILVDPELALRFKKGEKVNLNEVLAYPVIYRDVRSTEAVAASDLQKSFGTTDVMKIAAKIIKEGELQLTTEQRRHMIEQKKNQIADLIAKRGINPQTNTPHPPQRILKAIEQSGANIDPFTDAELQVEKVLKAIKQFLPIKFQKVSLQVKIPAQFAGKVFPILKSVGTLQQEQWLNDGSLQAILEILAGVQEELTQKIAGLTHGQYELKVLKREDV